MTTMEIIYLVASIVSLLTNFIMILILLKIHSSYDYHLFVKDTEIRIKQKELNLYKEKFSEIENKIKNLEEKKND